MTIEYGLTATGFNPKTLTIIREELNNSLRAAFGTSIDLGDRAVLGQIVGIVSEAYALLWELAEAVNSSQNPDAATGAALDALSALTGTFRPLASHSSVILTLTGTAATVIPAGSIVATLSTELQFETRDEATLVLLDNWAAAAYIVGDRVYTSAGGGSYECIVAGTSSSPGPVNASGEEDDGGVTWTFLGPGSAAVDVTATSVDTGVIVGATGDITEIGTAIDGWDSSINLADAAVGNDLGTDPELRALRELELASAGRSTVDSIIAALYALTDTIAVTLFVNNTDGTVDGLPPHSIEALVRGILEDDVADQIIWDTLLANVAAGIATYGGEEGTSVDSQGTEHVMAFSRPDNIDIYIDITVTVDPALYPSDGDEQIKNAISVWGNAQSTGKNAVASGISARAFTVPGVLDVTACLIDSSPSPMGSTTIAIGTRELAVYDTGNIDVTSSDGTP